MVPNKNAVIDALISKKTSKDTVFFGNQSTFFSLPTHFSHLLAIMLLAEFY